MTLIYPGAQYLAPSVIAEDGSVGIRIPLDEGGGEFCKKLIYKLRKPIVSTSANISGEPTPKSFADISEDIKSAVDYIVPKSVGNGASGKASQIIKLGLKGEVEVIRG